MSKLEEIRARNLQRTPGSWRHTPGECIGEPDDLYANSERGAWMPLPRIQSDKGLVVVDEFSDRPNGAYTWTTECDYDFIVKAPDDVTYLLQKIDLLVCALGLAEYELITEQGAIAYDGAAA
jgi:hypothetical protein